MGEGWAYYLLQYIYFPCKKIYIIKSLKKGKSSREISLSLSLSLCPHTHTHRDTPPRAWHRCAMLLGAGLCGAGRAHAAAGEAVCSGPGRSVTGGVHWGVRSVCVGGVRARPSRGPALQGFRR